jgi:hypothetical protein
MNQIKKNFQRVIQIKYYITFTLEHVEHDLVRSASKKKASTYTQKPIKKYCASFFFSLSLSMTKVKG